MLAASSSAPNSQRHLSVAATPRPKNWRGVTTGMSEAKKAAVSGQLELAEQLLLELLEFAPAETRAWKMLAKIQRKLGYIEAGISSARRALELQNAPANHASPASLTIARLLWQQGEYSEARSMLELLLSTQPENIQMLDLHQQWSDGLVE